MSPLLRFQAWLAGLWAGVIVAVGGIAAPSLFLVMDRQWAGLGAGRIFTVEAHVSLVVAIALFLVERRRVRDVARQAGESVMTANLLLVLGALFLTVFGHFALRPMMDAAKAGQGALSFGALHGISAVLFWLKGLLVLCLAWRSTALAGTGSITPVPKA